jgi:hypothetical protein
VHGCASASLEPLPGEVIAQPITSAAPMSSASRLLESRIAASCLLRRHRGTRARRERPM